MSAAISCGPYTVVAPETPKRTLIFLSRRAMTRRDAPLRQRSIIAMVVQEFVSGTAQLSIQHWCRSGARRPNCQFVAN